MYSIVNLPSRVVKARFSVALLDERRGRLKILRCGVEAPQDLANNAPFRDLAAAEFINGGPINDA
jgi:hypothetical protein